MTTRVVGLYSLDVQELPDGRVELTRKFVDGMAAFARGFPEGEVVAVLAPRTKPDTNLDQTAWTRSELPFTLVVKDARDPSIVDVLRGASVAVVGADYRHAAAAHVCTELGVPYVVVAEYNLRTRLQIAVVEEPRVNKRMRRMVWEVLQEAQQRRMVADAAGLQCNGTPIYEAWSKINPSPLLYFDTRVSSSMLASEARGQQPAGALRLAFSGRLIPMKGVLHLVETAEHLRALRVPFTMRIFGGGDLEEDLRARIGAAHLDDVVTLEGVLPFPALLEELRANVDLFVCPHVQGNPSCTYLETMACGVPIVGFDNDAWRGLARISEAGWVTPLGDARALAEEIARLDGTRPRLIATGAQALRFASAHTFEATFTRRSEHVKSLARAEPAPQSP